MEFFTDEHGTFEEKFGHNCITHISKLKFQSNDILKDFRDHFQCFGHM